VKKPADEEAKYLIFLADCDFQLMHHWGMYNTNADSLIGVKI